MTLRWENVYVAGIGTYLPAETVTAAQAVADGRYDASAAKASGIRAVRVAAEDEPGPVMAVRAGRQAIERAGVTAEDVDLVLHAYVGHQGQELWSPAHYVLNETVGGRAAAIELRQGCNGALAATELAASYLAARPDTTAALITTGDTFKLPHVDRWSADDQTVYGDGAAALVLSKRGGFARLLSTATLSEPSLEPLYRGTEWTEAPFAEGKPVDLTARKDSWLMRNEDAYDDAMALIGERFAEVLQVALTDAGTTLAETQWFVHANVSRQIAEWGFHQALGLDVSTTPYEWGLDHGHMGNSDQFMGINHLIESGRPKAGDKLVTIGVGIGFMWTVAVLEFTETPAW